MCFKWNAIEMLMVCLMPIDIHVVFLSHNLSKKSCNENIYFQGKLAREKSYKLTKLAKHHTCMTFAPICLQYWRSNSKQIHRLCDNKWEAKTKPVKINKNHRSTSQMRQNSNKYTISSYYNTDKICVVDI